MPAKIAVDRAQVLAYRVAAQGLHRDAGSSIGELTVLDIGVQEAMGQPAALAFAARLPLGVDVSPPAIVYGPGTDLGYVWSLRGAPHVHHRRDLDRLAAALWPLSEADAAGRLNETGPSIARQGRAALEQFTIAVEQLRVAVPTPTAKGAASTTVSALIPEVMLRDCRPCRAKHISDSAMRAAFLPAGLELEPGTSPPVLVRRKGARRPKKPDLTALSDLARRYLTLLGPATVGEFAGYVNARRADLAAAWPDDLVEVTVDGRRAWLPDDCVDGLRAPADPAVVRLLGPFDPFLQARDWALIVPDKAVQKVLWPVLGRPGAVLVDGELVGAWRTKSTARKLTITVEAFAPLPKSIWTQLESEAERVGQVRGLAEIAVTRKT